MCVVCVRARAPAPAGGAPRGRSKHRAAARCTMLLKAPPQQINVSDPQTQLRNVYAPAAAASSFPSLPPDDAAFWLARLCYNMWMDVYQFTRTRKRLRVHSQRNGRALEYYVLGKRVLSIPLNPSPPARHRRILPGSAILNTWMDVVALCVYDLRIIFAHDI